MTTLDQLRESRRALRAAIADATCDVSAARRAAAFGRASASRGWDVQGHLRDVVLLAYALSGYSADAAVCLLNRRARQYGWRDLPHDDVVGIVEDLFLAADVDELAALRDPEGPHGASALTAATAYVEEWRLAQWVAEQNRTAGVSPTTASVLERYSKQCADLPASINPAAQHVVGSAAVRSWASRWRRRLGGRWAVLRPCDQLPLDAMREKAFVPNSSP